MKDRFKPFRDKERPADYGRNLAPNPEKTEFIDAFSIAPSPSGDLIATVTINRKDQELDIVLISSKDGSIVRNLTSGFDKDLGFDHIIQMPYRGCFSRGWRGRPRAIASRISRGRKKSGRSSCRTCSPRDRGCASR